MSSANLHLFFGVHIQKKFVFHKGTRILISLLLYPLVFPVEKRQIRVTCLSDLNSAESLSFLLSVPSELKSVLEKCWCYWLGFLSAAWKACGFTYCNKGGLCCHMHMEAHRAKRGKDRQNWKSASAIKSAAAVLNLTGPHSTECTTTFLQAGIWAPSNALQHKVTNVCRVLRIFFLTPTPTHTCTDCVTSEKTKPGKAECLKAE